MKKVKVIFADGSTADIDESQVDAAIAAGAKRYTGGVATEKSTSMVFPDGSIADIPTDKVDGAMQAGAKKKVGGNGIGTPADANTTLPQPAASTSSSQGDNQGVSIFDNKVLNPALGNQNQIITPDGVQFPLTNPTPLGNSPEDIQALQQRVANKTTTLQDAQVLAQSSGKSIDATQAYLTHGKDMGTAIEVNENAANQNQKIIEGITDVGKLVGLHFNADDILSSADKSAQVLHSIKQIQQTEIDKRQQALNYRNAVIASPSYSPRNIPAEVPELDPQRQQEAGALKEALISNVKKLTADEAIKNGWSSSETGDKLYQRLDPVGYAQNQKLRQPNTYPTATSQIRALSDWVMGSQEKNKEALNAEKSEYALQANQGMRDLAIETKAKAIANNDPALLIEANNIISKIKADSEIIESSPMLMKQQMAQYINQKIAEQSGVLEGTDPQGLHGRILNAFGGSVGDFRKILKDGGYYDRPNFKDYADDVATHQNTYLADNSAFGGLGMSFLKPFVSIFNTVGDITGVRTKADIHAENIRDEMFPKQLTENVKKDISFNIAGHQFDINVGNTLNSVANLGGYAAIAAATGGLGAEAGLSANAAARVGAWSSFGMDAVDSGLKEADKMGLTPAQSWLYAGMKGVMMAEGGRLLELGGNAHIPSIAGVNETIAKAAVGITDKTLAEDGAKELINGAANAWGEGLKKYGISTVKGAGVLSAFGVGGSMLKIAFGDKNVNPDDILPEAANAYMQGLFTMGLFGAVGIKGNVDHAKNSTYKGMLSKIIDNPDATEDVLKIGLDRGIYSNDEYNQKVQILNTGINSKATLNAAIEKTGVKLSPDQKAVWIANATIERSLRNQAEISGVSEADANNYLKKADSFKEQNSQVLDGLTFNKFLEPNTALYDAQKAHKEALAEYTANPTPDNEKIVLNKKEAIDKVLYSPKTNQNENVKEGSGNASQTQTKDQQAGGAQTDNTQGKQEDVLNNQGAGTKPAPSIEELKKVELKGVDQKYKKVDISDPVFGERNLSAQKIKLEYENRHDALTKFINCLT